MRTSIFYLLCSFLYAKKFSTFYSLHFQWWIFFSSSYMDHWPRVIIFWPWISRKKIKLFSFSPIHIPFSHRPSAKGSFLLFEQFFDVKENIKTFFCSFPSFNESINHYFRGKTLLVCWQEIHDNSFSSKETFIDYGMYWK